MSQMKLKKILNHLVGKYITNKEKIKLNYAMGYQLLHPHTDELIAIFQGYSDRGSEVWLTSNGIEHCTFEGFTHDGWTRWSQSMHDFMINVSEKIA